MMSVRKATALFLGVFITAALAILSSCSLGDGNYFVSFTAEGTAYTLPAGFDDNVIDSGANGCLRPGSDQIRIAAAGDNVTTASSSSEGPIIWISIDGMVPGTYTDGEADIYLYTGSEDIVISGSETISITITHVSDVIGGEIRGTFSAESDTGQIIANGAFIVERVTDDSLTGPGYFS